MDDEWQDENVIRNVMENVDQISRMQFGLCGNMFGSSCVRVQIFTFQSFSPVTLLGEEGLYHDDS